MLILGINGTEAYFLGPVSLTEDRIDLERPIVLIYKIKVLET